MMTSLSIRLLNDSRFLNKFPVTYLTSYRCSFDEINVNMASYLPMIAENGLCGLKKKDILLKPQK
ncbi:MAG: hypothetical protein PHV50_09060 [Syntrophaceticus sp.]|nr:hypothetical protein [Syntrophaceticus sp.]